MRPAREKPIRLSATPAPADRDARDAAAAIAGPALRAILRGDDDGARRIVAAYDDETIDALTAAADRLGAMCRASRGRRS
jgi:hypothetical protein